MTKFREILVGWDNSPGAAAALHAAAAIAADDAVHVTALAVLRPAPHTEDIDEGTADFEGRRDFARETFGKARATLDDTVCEYAQDRGFDLLVLGRHGAGGLLHPRLGHVAATAARKSGLPVLLAP